MQDETKPASHAVANKVDARVKILRDALSVFVEHRHVVAPHRKTGVARLLVEARGLGHVQGDPVPALVERSQVGATFERMRVARLGVRGDGSRDVDLDARATLVDDADVVASVHVPVIAALGEELDGLLDVLRHAEPVGVEQREVLAVFAAPAAHLLECDDCACNVGGGEGRARQRVDACVHAALVAPAVAAHHREPLGLGEIGRSAHAASDLPRRRLAPARVAAAATLLEELQRLGIAFHLMAHVSELRRD